MNNCPHCGTPMSNPRRVQCGAADCKRAWQRQRMRTYFAAYNGANGEPYTARYRERRREQDRAYRVRVPHWRQRHPELAHAHDRERAKRPGVQVGVAEVFAHREIFERDAWRCGVCTKSINPELTYPHPSSASLDHVVPLSEGGQHTRANTRATHLRCNLSRGARGGNEQLALV